MYGIILYKLLKTLVGAAGFELATPCAQGVGRDSCHIPRTTRNC
jgi:hypothetical protein